LRGDLPTSGLRIASQSEEVWNAASDLVTLVSVVPSRLVRVLLFSSAPNEVLPMITRYPRRPLRSYVKMRPQQISERGPRIGRLGNRPIYEWIRLAGNPAVKYEYAGLAPSPLPGTLYEPGRTVLAVVIDPGLAYEPAAMARTAS
jgi:hypothetical protein